jgi:uncharacterized protein (TIGR01370 family)
VGGAIAKTAGAQLKELLNWAVSAFTAVTSFLSGHPPSPKTWAVFYGAQAPLEALHGPDLLVLEPDHHWRLDDIRRPGQKILAYLSLGEVHRTRPYFAQLVAEPGALLGPNPDWPAAVRVDPQSSTWRHLLLDEVTPAILAQGYDGFFLDTVDTAPYLESRGKLPGGSIGMANLIRELRGRVGAKMLISNGGIGLLPKMAGALDGLASESVLTNYNFEQKTYAWRAPEDASARRQKLLDAAGQYQLPIFIIEYVDPADIERRALVARQLLADGFIPYVTDIGLASPPSIPTL